MAPRVELAQLSRLCDRPETLARAQALYSLAKAKTGTGSGFNIDDQRAALPAVCALLASQELQNDDVSQEVAQRASCLTPHAFGVALRVVRLAVQGQASPSRRAAAAPKTRGPTFESLCAEYDVSADHRVGMDEARAELVRRMKEGSPRACRVLNTKCATLLACVIFYWACKAIKRRDISDKKLRAAWDIAIEDWKHCESIVEEECRAVKESLIRSAAANAIPTPSASPRRPSKKDDLMASLLRGSDPKAKVVADDAGTPTKSKTETVTPAASSPAPAIRFVGAPQRAPLPVTRVAQTSPSKRKADDASSTSDMDLASPRKRQFAPITPSKLRAQLNDDADADGEDGDEDEDQDEATPAKLNLKAKFIEAAAREPSQTPTTPRRYVGQRPPAFLPSPSASPLKASTPTKAKATPDQSDATPTPTPTKLDATPKAIRSDATPTKPKPKGKAYPASLSKPAPTPAKAHKPTRRVTRSAARKGFYCETSSDSELELSDDALADPARNLFTQAVSDGERGGDSEDEDSAERRRALLVPARAGGTARLLMRGGARVERVFRDRQAVYRVEPVLAAKLRAWKRAQAALDAAAPSTPVQRKRKAAT